MPAEDGDTCTLRLTAACMLQLPGTTSDVDLAPQQLLPQIDRLNDLIYNQVEGSSAV